MPTVEGNTAREASKPENQPGTRHCRCRRWTRPRDEEVFGAFFFFFFLFFLFLWMTEVQAVMRDSCSAVRRDRGTASSECSSHLASSSSFSSSLRSSNARWRRKETSGRRATHRRRGATTAVAQERAEGKSVVAPGPAAPAPSGHRDSPPELAVFGARRP